MSARKITARDQLIWELLEDPRYRVTRNGTLQTRVRTRGLGPWRTAGWVSPSRGGEKIYRRTQYRGVELYVHRIVWAAVHGHLCPYRTINHKDLNGLNNRPSNLELITESENCKHARAYYMRTGMTARQVRAKWILGKRNKMSWKGTTS